MIQRLQSLYLLLAAMLLIVFMVVGDGWRIVAAMVYPWIGPVATILAGIIAATALLAVFLYKDRQRQRQVVSVAQWLDLVLVLLLVGVMVVMNLREDVSWERDAMLTGYISALLPFIAYILLRLARQGIEKDIALVRSMDRLR
jgi:hypothetical protein